MILRKPSKSATRQAWSWWTSQLHMTRYGTMALPWSYPWPSPCAVHLYYHLQPQLYTQDKRRTGRPIASTKNGVLRAQSWLRHYLTSTLAISLPPCHSSTHMQTTLHSLYFDRNWTTVKLDGSTLPCNSTPTSLRVKLDIQLTFKQHIAALRGKVASRNNLLRHLAGLFWGAHTRRAYSDSEQAP